MNFEITEGVVNGAQKVVFYGPEGIGKTKFASNFLIQYLLILKVLLKNTM